MATCYVCHKGTLKGHWVSHSNIKTRRFFKPNLHTLKVQFMDKAIKQVKICSKCYKKLSLDFWAGKTLKFTPLSLLNQKKATTKAQAVKPVEVKPIAAKSVKTVKKVLKKQNGKEKGAKS